MENWSRITHLTEKLTTLLQDLTWKLCWDTPYLLILNLQYHRGIKCQNMHLDVLNIPGSAICVNGHPLYEEKPENAEIIANTQFVMHMRKL